MLSITTTTELLKKIKDPRHSINQQDFQGFSLLHKSFIKNHEFKEILLKNGADPNIRNLNDQSPLFYVKSTNDVALLLKYGALITLIDVYGNKAYHSNKFVKEFLEINENKFKKTLTKT